MYDFGYRIDSEQRKSRNLPAMKISGRKQRSKPETNGILKFDKISCEALDPKILLYNRIFKTGSSTTESLIVNSSASLNYDYKIGKNFVRNAKYLPPFNMRKRKLISFSC